MLLSKDDFMRAVRGSDVRTALHGFAQDPDAPLFASLQQFVDELIRDASRTRIIISGRRVGRSAVMAEIAKQMASKADKAVSKSESGGATVPCPWGREDSRETFCPTDYLPMNDPSKKMADDEPDALRYASEANAKEKRPEKPPIGLKSRFIVDRQRISEILGAMGRYNSADKAIPEEWMDELSDLVWRERDRLEGNNV
jgi:hypothetical protein